MKRFFSITAIAALILQTGCAYTTAQGKTKIVAASAEDDLGGTGTSSVDVRSMAERMAREIANLNWPQTGVTPRISVLPILNTTRFRVDPKLIQNKLVKDLVTFAHGRVQFLARDSEEAVMLERQKKRAGIYDQGTSAKAMAGADYLLKGEIRSLSKASREGVRDYILYSFTLIEAETAVILWAGDFETKKEGTVGIVYQ